MRVQLKTVLFAFAAMSLAAQGRFRLADPNALSASGSGWAVEPRLGTLSLGLPVATVGGDLPVNLSLQVNGSYKQQVTDYYEYTGVRPVYWLYDYTVNLQRPMYGTLNFGYITGGGSYSGATEPSTYVLESGAQFRAEDFGPMNVWAVALTLPQSFKLGQRSTSNVQESITATHLTYTANVSDLGSQATLVQSVAPSGYGAAPTQWRVLMDHDRARIYAFISDFNAWMPLVWLDRFGRSVTFKWTKGTANLPAGVTAVHSVKILNDQGKGVLVQWPAFTSTTAVQDVVRADFIGIAAPTVALKGYPSYTTAQPEGYPLGYTVDGTHYLDTTKPDVAGPVFRPTRVDIGSGLASPSWITAGQPIPAPTNDGTLSAPTQTWIFGLDATQAAIKTLTDPLGVVTTFTYGKDSAPNPNDDSDLATRRKDVCSWGVRTASTVDGATALNRSWTPGTLGTGEATVTYREAFGALSSAPRESLLVFAKETTRDLANGALKQRVLKDTSNGAVLEQEDYTLEGAGLDSSLSKRSGTVLTRQGEPKRVITTGSAYYGLTSPSQTLYVGDASLKVQTTANTYDDDDPAQMIINRLTGSSATRYKADGSAWPTVTRSYVYDGDGLMSRSAVYGGDVALGSVGRALTYGDGTTGPKGRLLSDAPYNSQDSTPSSNRAYTYDASGQVIKTTTTYASLLGGALDKSFNSQVTAYDSAGRPLTLLDERGVQTDYTYDQRGRVRSVKRAGDPDTDITYPDERTRSLSRHFGSKADGTPILLTTTETYDGFGRLVRQTRPDGGHADSTYDSLGRPWVLSRTDGAGQGQGSTTTTYDLLDRVLSGNSPAGSLVQYAYSATGTNNILARATTTVDPSGINAVSTEDRDALGQVVASVSATGVQTIASFDGMGNLILATIQDPTKPEVQTRTFHYDALGRLDTKTEPETNTQVPANLNVLGLPGKLTEASGTGDVRDRYLTYDGLGRLVKVLSGTDNQSWTFNGVELASVSRVNGSLGTVTQSFLYNQPGRHLSDETTTLGTVSHTLSYGYDAYGRLHTLQYPSTRVVTYTYDDVAQFGRLVKIQQRPTPTGVDSDLVSAIAYNSLGQLYQLGFGSTAYSRWTTKAGGSELDQWTIGYVTGGLTDPNALRQYTYDTAERLSQAGEWSLVHDKDDRIIAASGLGTNATFGHDAFGNNTVHSASGSTAFNNYGFNPLPTDRLPGQTATSVATGWDINFRGEAKALNVLAGASASTMALTWDNLGSLRTVTLNGSSQTSTYAPSGMRVRVTETNTANSRRYAYNSGGMLMGEYTDANGWKRDVVYLGSQAIAEIDAAGVHELHDDHLGSPRIITKGSTGQIEGRQAFGAYGERILSEGYVPLTGYTGHAQQDSTGLIYMRGRYYSPAWHRFLNSDQGVDPASWNQMAYVGGSPFMAVDPSGMMEDQCINGQLWADVDGKGHFLPVYNPDGSAKTCASGSNGGLSSVDKFFLQNLGYGVPSLPSGERGGGGYQLPPMPQIPRPCGNTGINLGLTAQIGGVAGVPGLGAGAQGSVNLGFYGDSFLAPRADTALSASGGGDISFAGVDFVRALDPDSHAPSTIGLAGGPSVGFFFGNASHSSQNDGAARTTSAGIGIFNVSFTKSGDIWSASVTFGKPGLFYFSSYMTHSTTLASENNRGCK